MPLYKYISNRFLTFFQNLATGQKLSEWHTGMRAYSREVLETVPFAGNSDDFVFDSQILFQAVRAKFRIGETPVPVRYSPESSSINFWRSLQYGVHTLWLALHHWVHRVIAWR